jgi:ABC-type glycerol-3-phosphate transport system substrate-binding protein
MGKRFKWGAIAMTAVFAVTTMIAGCGSQSTGGQSGQDAPTITWLRTGDMASKVGDADDRIIQEIDKRVGIKLVIKMVPQNDSNKITVAMASGDYPDIVTMAYPNASVNQWIKDGILLPLNDYLKEMPTVKQTLDKEVPWSAVDGKYYGNVFLTQQKVSNVALMYRKDWLDKLKLKAPTNLDEMYTVLKAIRTKDPDGNGKEDTYGITAFTGNSSSPMTNLDWVFYAYGMPYADWALDNQGKVIPRFEHPSFKQGMQYLNKLYSEKLLDPEFMVNNTTQLAETKFFQNKVGIMAEALFRNYGRLNQSLKQVVPTGELAFMRAPKGPGGKSGMKGPSKGGFITSVTKSSKAPEKAAQLIEFLRSKEGFDLMTLGVEGIDYTKNGGQIAFNEAERAKDGFAPDGWAHWLTWGALTWPLESNYVPATEPDRDKELESVKVASADIVPNLVGLEPDVQVKNAKVLDGIYNEYFAKMVTGQGDLDANIKELGQKWRSQGGNDVLNAVQDLYNQEKGKK